MLISPSDFFTGVEAIYQGFLLGRIQRVNSRVELVTNSIDVCVVGDFAIVLFVNRTDCTLRETASPLALPGWKLRCTPGWGRHGS